MAIDELVSLVRKPIKQDWEKNHRRILDSFFGSNGGRYPSNAKESLKLRAPEGIEVPYAAYIHPQNPDSGAYGGTSLVFFPQPQWENKPCLVGMVVGTQGLSPDEGVLSRPGHARKIRSICAWLNSRQPGSAWAKQDPTRTDIRIPDAVAVRWPEMKKALERYGGEIYAVYRPGDRDDLTRDAILAFLDLLVEERGYAPLKSAGEDAEGIRSQWFRHLMPTMTEAELIELLDQRRFVILQGPPGTGKTHLAKKLLTGAYSGCGTMVQFHANTTYENFIGGLAPVHDGSEVGLRFAPRRGYLMDAVAAGDSRKHLLVLDEINRADLAKVLGEAIFLFEAADPDREVSLPYDFGPPIGTKLRLPRQLQVLGTMNTADRSIALVDVAVRRRFAFVDVWPSGDVVERHGCGLSKDFFRKTISLFVEHASEESMPLVPGHSYFLAQDERTAVRRLKFELAPLLREYLAQGFVAAFAENVRALIQEIEAL
ncbi:MAG: McrB family protein [Bryobacteraceae bacterium]